jgi:glycosyl transferase family 1
VNTLMITKFLPLPADSGGKQRSLAILTRLLRLGSVTLCAFREPGSDVAGLERLGATVTSVPWRPGPRNVAGGLARSGSISSARFWDAALARLVGAQGASFDHLQLEYTQMAPYARGVTATHAALDMHNVESALAASFATARGGARGIPYRMEAAALRRLERRAARRFDVVTVVSEADRGRLAAISPAIVAPNGWEPTAAPLPPASEPIAAFVALMGWPPNEDAALWLAREIWPRVRAELPAARLLLVGKDPGADVRALDAAQGIEVTGTVDDVRPYLARARVGLAPLRAAGGSRLKILESLDAGRPVVATSKGGEGLEDLVGDGLEIADGVAELATSVTRLLSEPDEAARLGARGRAAVAARHSWDAALAPLVAAVEAGVYRRPHERGPRP